jgi:xylulose-5-phosphate/fructose-6-phosphate phosphoketolase
VTKQLLYGRHTSGRFHINGYIEEGTTTTPFDMSVRNKTSRYHLIMQAIRAAAPYNREIEAVANERVSHYEYVLVSHREYIEKYGKDPEAINIDWDWC